jgi:hypothetical protein
VYLIVDDSSAATVAPSVWVSTAEAESPLIAVSVAASMARVRVVVNAVDGAVESTPTPNAITTASDRRLKIVFDICFLSIVVARNFLVTAGKDRVFTS